jgi:hypothetical protein
MICFCERGGLNVQNDLDGDLDPIRIIKNNQSSNSVSGSENQPVSFTTDYFNFLCTLAHDEFSIKAFEWNPEAKAVKRVYLDSDWRSTVRDNPFRATVVCYADWRKYQPIDYKSRKRSSREQEQNSLDQKYNASVSLSAPVTRKSKAASGLPEKGVYTNDALFPGEVSPQRSTNRRKSSP